MRKVTAFVLLVLALMALPVMAQDATEEPRFDGEALLLATTTSTYDSGLLDAILPDFEELTGATVEVVAVGTGAALELGRNGDADVVLVHARELEDAFVEQGYGTARYDVMYNDFVVIGPEDDPAGIAELDSAAEAFAAIADAEALFVSRGDNSGTYNKELSIWESAEVEPAGDWYQEAGQGMGAVLTIANEQHAYTLTDRATYLARVEEGLELPILLEGDEALFNPYGVIPVNPDEYPSVSAELAQVFAEWLIEPETQALIEEFEANGTQLFYANADVNNDEDGASTATPQATATSEGS